MSFCVSDPRALSNARRDLQDLGKAVTFESDPYRAAEGAHAIAVLTEWDEFRDIQSAFLKASTPDIEIPTDHAIYGVLYRIAALNNVKYIFGHKKSSITL